MKIKLTIIFCFIGSYLLSQNAIFDYWQKQFNVVSNLLYHTTVQAIGKVTKAGTSVDLKGDDILYIYDVNGYRVTTGKDKENFPDKCLVHFNIGLDANNLAVFYIKKREFEDLHSELKVIVVKDNLNNFEFLTIKK